MKGHSCVPSFKEPKVVILNNKNECNHILHYQLLKGPVGGLKPNFTPGNWTGGENSGQITTSSIFAELSTHNSNLCQTLCCGVWASDQIDILIHPKKSQPVPFGQSVNISLD